MRCVLPGVNASDWKKRQGLMDGDLPQTMGYEAAGFVDELGDGVTDVAVGDRVFGLGGGGAAQAALAVLSVWAPIPRSQSVKHSPWPTWRQRTASANPGACAESLCCWSTDQGHDRLGLRSVAKLRPVPG